MKKSILYIFLCLAMVFEGEAQQASQYSLYMLNPYASNIAYSGLDESLSATAVFRKQWVGFPRSPIAGQFNAHLPLEFWNSAAGIGLEYEELGAYKQLSFNASYAYVQKLGEKSTISMSAGFRLWQNRFDGTVLRSPDGNYTGGAFDHADPIIPLNQENGLGMTMDAALYYKQPLFEVGIAANNLTRPQLDLLGKGDRGLAYERFYSLSTRWNIPLNSVFALHPSLMLQTDFVKLQTEIGIIFKYDNNIFGGLAFRGYDKSSQDALIILAGMQITPNIMLSYAYDWSLGSLGNYNSGSHEVILNYNLRKKIGKEIPSKVIYNPRFL